MTTYKLFRVREGRLFPLYVEHTREMEIGVLLEARVGELADATHVKSRGSGGKLALRPGFHSTKIPFTDWIGKKGSDGRLYQRKIQCGANAKWTGIWRSLQTEMACAGFHRTGTISKRTANR